MVTKELECFYNTATGPEIKTHTSSHPLMYRKVQFFIPSYSNFTNRVNLQYLRE